MKKADVLQLELPDKPGVYQFKDAGGTILYIGKATSLRDRTRSYFSDDLIATRGAHIVDMVTRSVDVSWIQTDSVLEALILEANLIKKLQPYYNTKEKDDRSFNYVVITKEDFPRVFTERKRVLDDPSKINYHIKYTFGPYPNGSALGEALRIIRRIFPFRDKKSNQSVQARFYKQLGLAPEIGDSTLKKEYQRNINHIRLFFQGKKSAILKELEREMKRSAKDLAFERASKLRNQIFALNHINDVSLLKQDISSEVLQGIKQRIEAFDIAHISGRSMIGVMTVIINGEADKQEYRTFNIRSRTSADDTAALREVLERRFKHAEWEYPDLIVIDGGKAQLNTGISCIKEMGLDIDVVSVVKDEKHKPKAIMGSHKIAATYQKQILLANSESHRFAIKTFRAKDRKQLLK